MEKGRDLIVERRFLFLLPALILIGTFVLYPTVETVRMSFWEWDRLDMIRFGGGINYAEVFGDKDFYSPDELLTFPPKPPSPSYGALINSFMWMAIFLPLITMLGLAFAVLLRGVRGGSIIKSMIFIGMVIPMVIGGVMVRFLFQKQAGVVNGLLQLIGLGDFAKTWTAFPETALFALILASVWIWTGFAMIIYSAGIELIPGDLYEAAKVDGASRWKIFWRITVPMLKPSTLIVLIMSLIWILRMFDMVYVATGGGPGGSSMVLGLLMYFYAFRFQQFGSAAAIATFLTLAAAVISIFLVRRVK